MSSARGSQKRRRLSMFLRYVAGVPALRLVGAETLSAVTASDLEGEPENQLVQALQAGDKRALTILYERYRGSLHKAFHSKLGDSSAAEDVVQDLFIRLMTDPNRFDSRRPLWPWLLTVGRRMCIDRQRKESRNCSLEAVKDTLPESGEDLTFEQVVMVQERERMGHLINQLPHRQRRALLFRVLEGWSHDSIAFAEDITRRAAVQLVVRARKNLRRLSSPPDS